MPDPSGGSSDFLGWLGKIAAAGGTLAIVARVILGVVRSRERRENKSQKAEILKAEQQRSDFEAVIEQASTLLTEYKTIVAEQNRRIGKLEDEIADLRRTHDACEKARLSQQREILELRSRLSRR